MTDKYSRSQSFALLVLSSSLLMQSCVHASVNAAQLFDFAASQSLASAFRNATFIATSGSSDIYVLDDKGQRRSRLSAKFPNSVLATDSEGDLYVTGNANASSFQVFSPPNYGYALVNLQKGQLAVSVTVNARTGVFIIVATHSRGLSEVLFFRHGAVKPCRVVRESGGFRFIGGGGFDRAGTLYTEVQTNNGESIVSISGECSAGALQAVTFKTPFVPTLTFQFNNDDNLVMQALLHPNDLPVYTFKHPKDGKVGDPIGITRLPSDNGREQISWGLTSDGKHLLAGGFYEGDLGQFAYPVAVNPEWFARGFPGSLSSVAVTPPLVPGVADPSR